MKAALTLFVVDDNLSTRRVLQAMLAKDYSVEAFESGAACIERLKEKIPALFLLDVAMPDMDGYELCQHIKQQNATREVPVIFISGYDDLEARLRGYEVGGRDFIVKPYKPAELLQRVSAACTAVAERINEAGLAAESLKKATQALTQIDELSVLVKFLSVLNTCRTPRELAAAVLALLKAFHLDGGLQIRQGDSPLTIGHQGEDQPLEIAVFSRIRDMGPLVQFKTHAAFNFARISVAATNMPLDDAERCERLRGHLTLAAQTVNAKLQADAAAGGGGVAEPSQGARIPGDLMTLFMSTAGEVGVSLANLGKARSEASVALSEMMHELDEAYVYLGLSEDQEKRIKAIVGHGGEELTSAFAFGDQATKKLENMVARLTATFSGRP